MSAEGTRALSQSSEYRLGRGLRDKSTAPSTSASSMYDGSVHTSGFGYSQGSRSSGSSTFGAFDGEDSFVYFTHPVSSLWASLFVAFDKQRLFSFIVVPPQQLGSSDPFARFWNVLETAIDQISNPVAFASLPVELPQVVDPIHDAIVKKHRRKHRERSGKSKHREKEANKEDRDRRNEQRTEKASGKMKDNSARMSSFFHVRLGRGF